MHVLLLHLDGKDGRPQKLQARLARRNASRRERYTSDSAYRAKLRSEAAAMYMRKRKAILASNLTRYWTDAEVRAKRRKATAASYRKTMSDPQRRAERRRRQNNLTARQRLKRKLNT
jgi:hypothetical protein